MEGYPDWRWDYTGFMNLASSRKITMNMLFGDETWEEMLMEISRASVVVGLRGAATLLAATMGKVVMELTPDVAHRDWVAKWESVKYRMIYGKLEDMPAYFVLDRLGKQVRDLARSGELTWGTRRHSSETKELHGVAG
jgi:hypothetical protein